VWEDAASNPKHDTLVTITFTEQHGKTLFTFHQDVFETTSSRDAHGESWSSFCSVNICPRRQTPQSAESRSRSAARSPSYGRSGGGTYGEYDRDDTHGEGRQYAALVAENIKSEKTPKKGDKSNDEAQDRDTGRVARSAARAARGGEGTHAAQRRAGAAAAGTAVGADRQGGSIRDPPGGRPAGRATFAAA